mmetsp:Transcript_4370/g.6299  ORF Transcript_4370/g.6299 Transcript_4370/m.6299 type:complete len:172 (-) Transcript_4370:44-559(-)
MNSNPVPASSTCNAPVSTHGHFLYRSRQQIDLQSSRQYFAQESLQQTVETDEVKPSVPSESDMLYPQSIADVSCRGRRRYQRRNSKVASMLFPMDNSSVTGTVYTPPKSCNQLLSNVLENAPSPENSIESTLSLQAVSSREEKDSVGCERKRNDPSISSFEVLERKRQKVI